MKNNYIIILIAIAFVAGCFLAHYGNKDSIINFVREFPNISGILLSGVLASLAIIFGLMGIEELGKILKIENGKSYENLLKELKDDVWVVLGVVITSTSISVFSSSDTKLFALTVNNMTISAELFKITFIIDFVFLIITLLAIYDIIIALFEISRLKYEAAKR